MRHTSITLGFLLFCACLFLVFFLFRWLPETYESIALNLCVFLPEQCAR